jgi:hypothetical protein
MNKRSFLIIIFSLLSGILLFSACSKPKETPVPTQEVYQPTRSVATVPVPTRAPTCNNVMSYLGDANYEDGSILSPGQKFTKEWEVINYSDCNWDSKYHLFFISGNQMGAPDFVEIPHIPIGSKGKIFVELTAPTEPGEYRSEWKLFGADNRFFGETLAVNIVVQ